MRHHQFAQLAIIYLIAIVIAVTMIVHGGFLLDNDSKSYLDAWLSLKAGHIDLWRTPIYPLFLGLIESVVGYADITYLDYTTDAIALSGQATRVFTIAIVLQHALFIASLYAFYRVVARIGRGSWIAFVTTLALVGFVALTRFNSCILTESLSISGLTMLTSCALRLHDRPTRATAVALALWSLLLIGLRPSFLFLIPALLMVAVALLTRRQQRPLGKWLLTAATSVAVITLAYCAAFQHRYGIFSPTVVGTVNAYLTARHDGLLEPALIHDAKLRAFVEHSIAEHGQAYDPQPINGVNYYLLFVYLETWQVIEQFPLPAVQQAVHAANQAHPTERWCNILTRFRGSTHSTIIVPYSYDQPTLRHLQEVLHFKMALLYLVYVVGAVVLLRDWLVQRKCDWLMALVWLMGMGNIAVTLLGATDGFRRLFTPSLILALLLVAYLVSRALRWGASLVAKR